MTVLLCYSACPDMASAARIARALVDERLAACVNVLPAMQSLYRWRGEVEDAEEALLMIKTTRERLAALGERLRALHPYELPELIAVEAAGGSSAYLDWVEQQTLAETQA